MLVPLLHRETGVGIFAAFDQDAGGFTDEDLGLLRAFAQSTAHAIATGTTERNPEMIADRFPETARVRTYITRVSVEPRGSRAFTEHHMCSMKARTVREPRPLYDVH